MKPLKKTSTIDKRTDAISFADAGSSLLIHLQDGVQTNLTIPDATKFVRFAYPISTGTVWVSLDTFTLPSLGNTTVASVEPNPIIRYVENALAEGNNTLVLEAANDDVLLGIYFYGKDE